MKSIYKEGAIFKSKRQKTFRVRCSGSEGISFFEALKISPNGCIINGFKNYNKDAFELEIQLTEKQEKIKKSILNVSNNLKEIANSLEKMNNPDIICSLGGNISLIKLQIKNMQS